MEVSAKTHNRARTFSTTLDIFTRQVWTKQKSPWLWGFSRLAQSKKPVVKPFSGVWCARQVWTERIFCNACNTRVSWKFEIVSYLLFYTSFSNFCGKYLPPKGGLILWIPRLARKPGCPEDKGVSEGKTAFSLSGHHKKLSA